ncbi:aminoglycoside phosphotransferase family protein [Rhizobium rhizogenes]|uniref:aminoglycoside phosphotransferase family protein n=1 Tax=Rhizobium rhizogenes TaxID=359 RepID=UPI0024BE69FE|nr:aminoglycoside phosphotransferase family protein [Rhizobium rhizogenes]MDJ1638177.1 aminoglycoside phosphotransferase family protein [Rhizobium rhizogenes]
MIKQRSTPNPSDFNFRLFLDEFDDLCVTRAPFGKASAVYKVRAGESTYYLKFLNAFSRREFDVYAAHSHDATHLPKLLNLQFGIEAGDVLLMEDVSVGRSHPDSKMLAKNATRILTAVSEVGQPLVSQIPQKSLQTTFKSRLAGDIEKMAIENAHFSGSLQTLRNQVTAWIGERLSGFFSDEQISFIHGNLNPGNILLGDYDVKLIDFENYDVGIPLEDLVNLAFFFPPDEKFQLLADDRSRAIALMYLDKILTFYATSTDPTANMAAIDRFRQDYMSLAHLVLPSTSSFTF